MTKTLIKKQFREKGKSKYLEFRPELQAKPDYLVDGSFLKQQKEIIQANRIRRANMKINQPKYPDSYYKDCYVNSEKYKNRYKVK